MAKQGKAGTQSGKKITANERKYLKVKTQLDDAIKQGKELIKIRTPLGDIVQPKYLPISKSKRAELEKKVYQAMTVVQGASGGKAQNKRGGGKVKKYAHGGKVRSYNFIN